MSSYSISPLGDEALLIDFSGLPDEAVNRKVHQCFTRLQQAALPFVSDLVPAYSSLAVYYNSYLIRQQFPGMAYDMMVRTIHPLLLDLPKETLLPGGRHLEVPVCYALSFAPDLEELATLKELSITEVIAIHTAGTYRVYMMGFLPGFAYMGPVDERIALPRKSSPREKVLAGSVGIAGNQTGIYPFTSPGGWQIIGRTPIRLFDRRADPPVFFAPNDTVTFYSITEDEFTGYQGRGF